VLRLRRAHVDKIRRVGLIGVCECADADAEETEFRSVGFSQQQRPRRGKNLKCQLRRRVERESSGANLKIRRLEFKRNRRAGERLLLQSRRNSFAFGPENPLQPLEFGDILLESRFRRDAFGFAFGVDLARIDAAGEPGKAAALAQR